MTKNRFISNLLSFLAVFVCVLSIYLWLWNPLGKEYESGTKSTVACFVSVLFCFSYFLFIFYREDQAKKEFTKNIVIIIKIYQLVVLLSSIVYYLFISPANTVILGFLLLITVLIIGVCLFIYAKIKVNKNTVSK